MNCQKLSQGAISLLLAILFLGGCSAPATTSLPPTSTPIPPTLTSILLTATLTAVPRAATPTVAQGTDVNARDNQGFTQLWGAAFEGDITLVESLLNSGADPNLSITTGDMMDGFAPLHALGTGRDPAYLTNAV